MELLAFDGTSRAGSGALTAAETARSRRLEVRAKIDASYRVLFEHGLLARYGSILLEETGARRVAVLTDRRVDKLYGGALRASLAGAGIAPLMLVIPDGERSKTLRTFGTLLGQLATQGFDRRGVLVNFGGGVISDLGGFLASAYMRGVAYVNLSTSLIGQLDAAIGGKVAVNTSEAKNLVGAFHHPRHVAGDPALLRTLSFRDFRSGIAEAIKVAIIASPRYFAFLEENHASAIKRDPDVLVELVAAAAQLKIELLAADPYESDLRRPLNLGHTIGHPIETEFGYRRIRHGEAVAIGIGVATMISFRRGEIAPEAKDRILALLRRFDLLGLSEEIRPDSVLQHMRYVKLIRGNALHFVLPRAIGDVAIVNDLGDADIVRGFEDYEQAARATEAS